MKGQWSAMERDGGDWRGVKRRVEGNGEGW